MRRKYLRSLHLQDAFLTGRIHEVRYHYRDLKQLESCIQITSYARGVEDVTLQVWVDKHFTVYSGIQPIERVPHFNPFISKFSNTENSTKFH